MSDFSDWTTNIFSNGTTPAINEVNLNKNENALEDVMDELNYSHNMNFKRIMNHAYTRSERLIDNFESIASYSTSGAGTFTQDYDVRYGRSGIRITETNDTAGLLGVYKTITAMDLTEYNFGYAEDNDYIVVSVYLSDVTKFEDIYIRLGDDSSNYRFFTLSTGDMDTGWNIEYLRKDYWSTTGSPSALFSNVAYVFFGAITYASASGEYCVFDICTMGRRDSSYLDSNPFFFDDGTGTLDEQPYIVSNTGSLVYNDTKIMRQAWMLNDADSFPTMNEVLCTVNSFCLQAEIFCKNDGYAGAVQWYVDTSNYFLISVQSDTLLFYQYVSGSGSTVASTSLSGLVKNDRVLLDIEKQGTLFRVSLTVDGDAVYYLDYNTTIVDSAGCVGFTRANTSDFYAVTNFTVGHNRSLLTPNFGKFSRIVRKNENEDVIASTSLQDDDELYVKLPPNRMIKIRSMIQASSTSATPDITVGYSISGEYEIVSSRYAVSSPPGVTDVKDSNTRFFVISSFTYPAEFGLEGTADESYINDEFFIFTGPSGNTVQFRFAQLSSSVSATTIEADSYIYAIEL